MQACGRGLNMRMQARVQWACGSSADDRITHHYFGCVGTPGAAGRRATAGVFVDACGSPLPLSPCNPPTNMVAESRDKLRGALRPACVTAAAALTLEAFGALIGMFELNNLGITVPSAVGQYFAAVLGESGAEGEGKGSPAVAGVDRGVVEAEVKTLRDVLEGRDCPVQVGVRVTGRQRRCVTTTNVRSYGAAVTLT